MQALEERQTRTIQSLQSVISELKTEIVQAQRRASVLVPTGLVAAFDTPRGCPSGWSTFREGSGRVIVGSGRGNFDENEEFLSARQLSEKGGAEQVILTRDMVPVGPLVVRSDTSDAVTGDGLLRLLKEQTIRSTSISQWALRLPAEDAGVDAPEAVPHNNMPPFVVLHLCRKE
ncbi:hypothetical protein [uncultured Tateyamaria sp.]|uniref:hypothetical protein n=1 Tax=uncultured Tateyamaria sp. TaxID=455651 RepID=UPI00261F0E6C|nr:hypothetical protein [uncultured Tateyamaria sp.]